MNDPTILILTSLSSGEKHGYALLGDIERYAGVRLGPGTLYGAIGRLEHRGLIEPVGDAGRRRPYRLTAAGVRELDRSLLQMQAIVKEANAAVAQRPIPTTTSIAGASA